MDANAMIEEYLAGPEMLRRAIEGMSSAQLTARPIAGKWSTLEIVCHIADYEPIYADRMKRVIAEERPKIPAGDPDEFARRLAYHDRDLEEELRLIEVVRGQLARILRTLRADDFERVGIHSVDGPLTLQALLKRITNHIPHHLEFVAEKRRALGCA